MEKLKDKILEMLKERSKESVVLEMGYERTDVEQAVLRLDRLLNDDFTSWLMELDCDEKYFGEEFLVTLCDALNIDDSFWIEALNECRPLGTLEDEGYLPTLYAVTDFKGIEDFSPGKMEFEELHIGLIEYFEALEQKAEIEHIIQIVKSHYQYHDGKLRGWGNILYYSYQFNDNDLCFIYPDGKVTEACENRE